MDIVVDSAVTLEPGVAQELFLKLDAALSCKLLHVEGIHVNGQSGSRLENTRLRMEGDKNHRVFPGISIFQGRKEVADMEVVDDGELTLIFRGEKWATQPMISTHSSPVMIAIHHDYVEVCGSIQGRAKTYRFMIVGNWTQKHEDDFLEAERQKKEKRVLVEKNI
jgi:hypothetical protein